MYYDMVPKDLIPNLKFRKSILLQCEDDALAAEQMRLIAHQDILFYFNTFVWIFEPRTKQVIPFISWSFQDYTIRTLEQTIRRAVDPAQTDRQDLYVEKSRDMGASWMALGVLDHEWIFESNHTFLLGSRSQDCVDDREDPSSLMWKLDHIHRHLPPWLLADEDHTRSVLKDKNHRSGSMFKGESTSPNFGRSGRFSAVLLDEFGALESAGCNAEGVMAATADTTRCRILISTHQGTHTCFYRVGEQMKRNMPGQCLRLHWQEHPKKNPGLYRSSTDGVLEILDKKYIFPAGYNFILDGKLRSPAYDAECLLRHPREMAQEWDVNPSGADWQYFDSQKIETLINVYGSPARWRGDIEYSLDPIQFVRFIPDPMGRFYFWRDFDSLWKPAADRLYVIGVDIAMATGASNSTISGVDAKTREKILSFVDPTISPHELARVAVATALCLSGPGQGAKMIWEAPGPGRLFGNEVIRLGYRNFFFRQNETSIGRKQSDIPGWWPTTDNKKEVYGNYKEALYQGHFINRDVDALRECLQYIYTSTGTIDNSAAVNQVDPSGARANHGDRVTADALANKLLGPFDGIKAEELPVEPPPGTFGWRRQQYKAAMRTREEW